MEIVWIVVLLVALALAVALWPLWLAIGIAWLGWRLFSHLRKEEEARQRAAERDLQESRRKALQREEAERYRRVQEVQAIENQRLESERKRNQWRSEIESIYTGAVSTFSGLSKCLTTAQSHIDSAAAHFTSRSFIAYWEAIDNAYSALVKFKDDTHKLKASAVEYGQLRTMLGDGKFEPFPVNVDDAEALKAYSSILKRWKEVAFKGETDFQFAQINVQRTTNIILRNGFASLESAIWSLRGDLVTAVDGLVEAVYEEGERAGSRSIENRNRQVIIANRQLNLMLGRDKDLQPGQDTPYIT